MAINDITEPWANHDGIEVETFLKQQITAALAAIGGKVGYADLEPSTMMLRFFESQGAQQPMFTVSLGGDIFRMSLNADVSSIFYILADETSKVITITPSTQKGSFGSSEYENYPEDHIFSVDVNNGNGYIQRIPPTTILSGESASFDVRGFVSNGDNYIRVTLQGASSGSSASFVFTAVVTTLTLSVNHAWQTIWSEGSDYVLTGIRFAGNLVKTLHVSIDGTELTPVVYNANQSYITTATTYTIPASAFPASENGVHEIKLWMTAQGISTREYKFNIMCVAEGDTTPLVTINAIAETVANWTSSRLFSYAVYGADKAQFDLSALLGAITYPIVSGLEIQNLVADTQYEFTYSIEIDTGANETALGTLTASAVAFSGSVEGEEVTISTAFDNSFSYLATPGYLFYMNASVRSNNDANRSYIVNEAGASQDGNFAASYEGEWSGFSWSGDAWDKDADGYKALHIPAGCSLVVPDFAPLGLMSNYLDGMTIELMIKNEYPADYDTPILTIGSTAEPSTGIFIYPTKIVVLGTYERSLVNQTVNISENRMTHLAVTFVKGYEGVNNRNLVSVYVNGISNVNFSFDASTIFGDDCLRIGQPDADTFIYRMRVYGTALDSQAIFNNFLNCVIDGVEFDRRERSEKNNLFEGSNIDYDKVKAAGFNTMVVIMTNDQTPIPSVDHPAPSDGYPNCTMRFEYAGQPNKNVTVSNVSIDGQGTTSKKYFRWNLRAKTKSGTTWAYGDGTEETGKKGRFINDTDYIKCDRITAKKNYASSMQGHKMGFTGLYNDLFKQIGLGSHLPNSDYRVAVFQFPFVGFRYYEANDSYEFIGLYTAGPDKGSKVTFGYSDSFMSLLSIEGPNHNPRGTRFLHPWVDVTYDPEQETLCFGGEEGWDCDFANYETSSEGTQADWDAIRGLYETEFRPAYECVYNNSPHIASVAEVIAAVDNPSVTSLADILNPEKASLITGVTIQGMLVPIAYIAFYDTEYELYFFRTKTQTFVKMSDVDSDLEHNLLTALDDYLTTQTPTTAQIIAARAARFKATASDYWDIDQTIFHYAFCELYGISDNFAKNSYPFKFLPLSASGAGNRWGWREDDMDTVLMTDNNGNNTKKYSVEPGDTSDNVQIFQGYNAALWMLIHDNYADEIRTMYLSIVNAASALATSLNIAGAGLHESLFNLTSYYCWEHSAKYFAETLYEKDRRWSYIQPWLENPSKEYNSVLPLTQALGDQYQAERLWMERRIAYIFSKYHIGAFSGDTGGYGMIALTLARQFTFHLTPAIDLYPTAATGSATYQGGRTEAGDTADITVTTTGDTTNYIKGGDWLASLGDLCKMAMTARGGGDISLSLVCARLRVLKIGDADASIIEFNADAVSINSPSLTYIDARNTVTIRNLVDLRDCPRLRTVLFGGSGASGMLLPVGAKVTEVSFPAASQVLFLHSLPFLENDKLSLPNLSVIQSIFIYNCAKVNAFDIVDKIFLEQSNVLAYVTATWPGMLECNSTAMDSIVSLENVSGKVIYENGSVQNVAGLPLVEGVLDIRNTLYRTLVPPELDIISDEVYGDYRKMKIGNFGTDLSIIYDPARMFPDPFVDDGWIWCYYNVTTTESATQLLYESSAATQFGANFIIDGVEVAKAYTYTFATTGEHLVKMKFSGSLRQSTYRARTNLLRIYFPSIVTGFGNSCFTGCSNLTHLYIPKNIVSIAGQECFQNCTKLNNINLYLPKLTSLGTRVFSSAGLANCAVNLPALTSYSTAPFAQTNIVAIENMGKITSMGTSSQNRGFCYQCTKLKKVVIPETVYSIGYEAFNGCTALTEINLVNKNISRIEYGAFGGTTSLRVELDLPNLVYSSNRVFYNSRITKVKSLGRLRLLYTAGNAQGYFGSDTALTEVTLPYTMENLYTYTFAGCTALKTITCYALTPPAIGAHAFDNVSPNKIYVPFDSVLAYKEATGWSAFASKIEPIPNSQSPLPEGYTRLTKVITDSNAWIDTGVAGATDLEIGFVAYWSTFVDGGAIYGNYLDELHCANRVSLYSSAGYFNVAGGLNLHRQTGRNEASVANELIVNSTELWINGFHATIESSTLLANTDNICLGNRSVTDPVEANIGLAIYDFWIKKAGVEILHYIPCERDSDNKRGFYDMVNNVFKPSDTEVDFT